MQNFKRKNLNRKATEKSIAEFHIHCLVPTENLNRRERKHTGSFLYSLVYTHTRVLYTAKAHKLSLHKHTGQSNTSCGFASFQLTKKINKSEASTLLTRTVSPSSISSAEQKKLFLYQQESHFQAASPNFKELMKVLCPFPCHGLFTFT